jgi:hypothetical protein
MRVLVLLPVLLLCLEAQTPEALERIRAQMTESLNRQPNYTCLETVERTRQDRAGLDVVHDTVRLEVALSNGKEMFAWPDSLAFDDSVDQMIPTGMFGTGSFALLARIVFASDAPEFEYQGEGNLNGRPVVRYDFQLPHGRPGYRIRVYFQEAAVGFHGSFYADRETGDIRRLEISVSDIPPDLGLVAGENQIDYERLNIGGAEYLLPVSSEVKMTLTNEENRNSMRFSACRRFSGESVMVFTDPSEELKAAPVKPKEVSLPDYTMLEIEFRNDFDLTQAAVGDLVEAVLRADVMGQKQVLAPKGAVAHGRIRKLERRDASFRLGIEFRDLEWPKGHAPLKAVFVRTVGVTSLDTVHPLPIVRAADSDDIMVYRPGPTQLKGIVMYWRTAP